MSCMFLGVDFFEELTKYALKISNNNTNGLGGFHGVRGSLGDKWLSRCTKKNVKALAYINYRAFVTRYSHMPKSELRDSRKFLKMIFDSINALHDSYWFTDHIKVKELMQVCNNLQCLRYNMHEDEKSEPGQACFEEFINCLCSALPSLYGESPYSGGESLKWGTF